MYSLLLCIFMTCVLFYFFLFLTLIIAWNISNVTDMRHIFSNASSFNQNISEWDVSNISNWTNFATNSGLQNDFIPAKFR